MNYQDIRTLSDDLIDQPITIKGRVHNIRKQGGKLCFLILRYQTQTLQCVAHKKNVGDDIKDLIKVPVESIIRLEGTLQRTPFEIKTTTYKTLEFQISGFTVTNVAEKLPFLIEDANCFGKTPDGEVRSDVGRSLRLDNRWVDLRVPVNMSIMFLQSEICQLFRDYLTSLNFKEIHSPKLISTASESGAEVFRVGYFDKIAFLAQSPQLYKQMAINADFDRVFEIGPVFRAEQHFTNRHLCEYVGMDLEMCISPDKDYHEILEVMWSLLVNIFDGLKDNPYVEVVKEKLPFELPVYSKEPLIIDFADGVEMLRKDGLEQGELEDLSTVNEKRLGELVKELTGQDLFILDKYPLAARPFYTSPHPEDERYSCSYDIIFRGKEICSGAQRVHDWKMLTEKIVAAGIDPSHLETYINSFKHGSRPHGGCGFGLERILMLYLDLDNIRSASFCPRDPRRLTP